MKRRDFLKRTALAALAASPAMRAAALVRDFGVPGDFGLGVVDYMAPLQYRMNLRWMARVELARWYGEKVDEAILETLT